MPSEVEICNLALQHLGESSIISLDDTGDKTSRLCGAVYPQSRDSVLQSVPWACAKKQATLSRLAEAPVYKWTAAYQLPEDFLRLVEIEGENGWEASEYFDRLGDQLVTDSELATINIEYIFRQTDSTKFDPLLVECLALVMAMKMARGLTGNVNKEQALREEYERIVLPRARTLNATQLYTGRNHPIRKRLSRSLLNSPMLSGRDSAAYPPSAEIPLAEEISDWSSEIE